MGTAIKHPVPDQVKSSFVIFDIRALWRSGLNYNLYILGDLHPLRGKSGLDTYERQSARMSKITNDDLTWSGTGCFIAVPMWQQ